MAEKRTEDPSRDRSVKEASGSDHELDSDFVERPEWKRNDGRNCVLSLFVKYRIAQGKKIVKKARSIPCTWNFLAYWNFYTKRKQGKNMLDDIVKKYGCSVTVCTDDEDLFIFEVTGTIFKRESDFLNFVNDVLNNIYKCAKQSLCCDVFSVDHRIQEDTLQRVKEKKELHSAWIVVDEHDPDTMTVVCVVKDKVSVFDVLTEVISKAEECYNNHEETVAVDFMWQRVLQIFGYLQEFNDKFPSILIKPDETRDEIVLKGPRDKLKAAADHLLELFGIARSEVHQNVFSPTCQFEILTYPEMSDYIDNFIPKLPIVWIPNNLTKKIHIFSKQPEQAKCTDKVIKGCIQEKQYTLSKFHSLLHPGVRSLEKLKQKHQGKIVIHASDAGLLVTTADDIFETVDAEIHEMISKERGTAGMVTKTANPTSGSSKSSKDGKEVEIQGNNKKGTSYPESTAGSDIPDKSETSTVRAENVKLRVSSQSDGASGGKNLSSSLVESDPGSDQLTCSSGSEDENTDDHKLLFRTPSGRTKVFVYEASIVNLSGISAIVNTANDRLSHAGGVAYHISKASGGDKGQLEKDCQSHIKKNGKLDVTKNYTSSAGDMPYEGVIHAVGPMWSDYKAKEDCEKDLCETIINVLVEADTRKYSKIALPAISSGIFGVPKKVCADMYIKGVIDYDSKNPQTHVREIHFVDISKDILQEIRDAYGRWKQNNKSPDKNAKSSISGSAGQDTKTVHPTSGLSGNPAASQHSSKSGKISTFQLSEKTCVKVYACSIVNVKDVDAVACAVNTDFSITRSAVAQAIRKAGGSSYEDEFQKMVSVVKPGSEGDVFICKTGGSLKSNNIDHVIHIKCEKLKNHEDMDKLKDLYVQVFQLAKKKKMEKIVMPLIGAASLQDASEDITYKCSQLFAKTLKEVVESRRKEINVKEIHLVDLNEKLIIFICKAFQELNTVSTGDRQAKGERKSEPVSKSKSDDPKKDSPQPRSGVGEGWLKVENDSKTCSYKGCKRPGTKKCAYCGDSLCDLCIPGNLLSQCPFCKRKFDLKPV